MNRFFRAISIGVLALAVHTSFGQIITAKGGVDYGSGNIVVETSGAGAPTSSCTGLKTYTQTDATAGQNIWKCISGTMTLQGSGAAQKSANLSDLASPSTARTNLGLGTAALSPTSAFDAAGAAAAVAAASVPNTSSGVTTALGYTPSQGAQHISGATIFLDMLPAHISGSTVQDQSGNGNNGTMAVVAGSTAPTSSNVGLTFAATSSVSLPAAVNAARTFQFAFTLPALPTNLNTSYPTILGTSLTGSGLTMIAVPASGAGFVTQLFAVTFWNNSTNAKLTYTTVYMSSGAHTVITTLGTGSTADKTKIYYDGNEVGSYGAQGFTETGLQSSGNYILGNTGASVFAGTSTNLTMHEFIARTAELTAAQVTTEHGAMVADMIQRGVTMNGIQWSSATNYHTFVGDSITFGLGATAGWPALLTLAATTPAATRVNLGISGQMGARFYAADNNRAALNCKTQYGPNITSIFDGTNDFQLLASSTPASVAGTIANQVQQMKSAGCTVFVGTMISRGGVAPANGSTWAVNKNALNSLIRAQYKQWGADGLLDFAADPNLGADSANASSINFQADFIHPKDAGQALLAAAASRSYNYFYGYKEAFPNVVTANTYTMADADGYISATPTANATYTLPSCIGQTGAKYTISNQTAFTITLKTAASTQTINGTDYSVTGLAVTAPTLTLQDVPNAPSTGGCHWEQQGVTAASSGGLADPGANGLLKRTSAGVTAPAVLGTDYYGPDAVSNGQATYQAGSGGDATCHAPAAGMDLWCYFTSANAVKRSVNGGAYALVPTSSVSISNITVVLPTTAVAAGTCSSAATATMTGLATTSAFTTAFASDPSAVAGWGANGGMSFIAWPTANTLNWRVCNQSTASITPGAMTLNVGAQ